MAIFGFKKRKDEKLEQNAEATKSNVDKKSFSKSTSKKSTKKAEKVIASKVAVPKLQSEIDSSSASVIIRPRITEKSGVMSQNGVYTFEISKNSNKAMVRKAIVTLYKVHPTKVAIVNTPAKAVFVRGRKGTVSGLKKAIVTVKKGEKIDFV
jgi:large subunit ribosomal protein L23